MQSSAIFLELPRKLYPECGRGFPTSKEMDSHRAVRGSIGKCKSDFPEDPSRSPFQYIRYGQKWLAMPVSKDIHSSYPGPSGQIQGLVCFYHYAAVCTFPPFRVGSKFRHRTFLC